MIATDCVGVAVTSSFFFYFLFFYLTFFNASLLHTYIHTCGTGGHAALVQTIFQKS